MNAARIALFGLAACFLFTDTIAYKSLFALYDLDNDDEVTSAEIMHTLALYGVTLTQQQADGKVEDADADESGTINFSEFKTYQDHLTESQLDAIYTVVDDNGDGYLDFGELRFHLHEATDALDRTDDELHDIFNDSDVDHNGKIDRDEFLEWNRHA